MRCSIYASMVFLGAVAIGSVVALISIRYGSLTDQYSKWKKSRELPVSELYRDKLTSAGLRQTRDNIPGLKLIPEADYLRSTVRLLCWVVLNGEGAKMNPWYMPNMMSAKNAVSETWGKHCSKIIFFTNARNPRSDAINIEAHSLDSWAATYSIIMHIASKGYLDQYDWFLKADEDTYVVVENLLYYLSVRNATDPIYLGHAYSKWGSTYNAGGAGYVLSKAAFRKLHTSMVKGQCKRNNIAEDVILGRCLSGLGIGVEDTRDQFGRGRFLMFHPESLLVQGNLPWSESFWTQTKYQSPEGPDCCSDYAVTFHYISPNMMYVFEYFIYHLKPYGITSQLVLPADKFIQELSDQKVDTRYQDLIRSEGNLLRNPTSNPIKIRIDSHSNKNRVRAGKKGRESEREKTIYKANVQNNNENDVDHQVRGLRR